MLQIADACWPFHEKVIESLRPRVIVCLGATAGNFVCEKLNANTQTDEFVERNNRRWTSRLFSNQSGVSVAVLTHPSIANWVAAASDPTGLMVGAVQNAA